MPNPICFHLLILRHAKPYLLPSSHLSFSSSSSSSSSSLSDILLAASLSKTLSSPSTIHPPHKIPSSLPVPTLLHLLCHPQILPSSKLSLFLHFFNTNSSEDANSSSSQSRTLISATLFTSLLSSNSLHLLLPALRASSSLVPPHIFKSVLNSLIHASRFDDVISALEIVPNQFIDTQIYSSIISALIKKSHISLALSLFHNALQSSAQYWPNVAACNQMLLALVKAEMREQLRNLFDEMCRKNFLFDLLGYNVLIHAFGSWGDLSSALYLFKEMKLRLSPDVCTYNTVIKVLCCNGRVRDGLKVYEEMKESGYDPDKFTYQTLICWCAKTYMVPQAKKVFKEMEYNSVRADTVVCNNMLDCLLKARRLGEACKFFEKMVSDGVMVSCYSFNILIDGLFKNGRPAAGFALFCTLKKKGQYVDSISYSIVICYLCREDRLGEALDFVQEMEERGFVVDLVTITSLLMALHKNGRWDSANKLLKYVKDTAILPNVLRLKEEMDSSFKRPQDKSKDYTPMFPSVGSLSDILCWVDPTPVKDDELISDGEEVKDEWSLSPYLDKLANKFSSFDDSQKFMVLKGQRVQDKGTNSFDVDMINTYLSIYLSKGQLSIACKLFEIFNSSGEEPMSYTYNSLLSSFIKKGYLKEAWGILQDMGKHVVSADVATFNLIIQGLGKMGKADLGQLVVDRMIKKGGYLDLVMYNTSIHTLGKEGRFDEVNRLFENLLKSGINPDVVTYNTLIEVHAKAGRIKDAYKFLRKMLADRISPNHVTDTILDFLEKEVKNMKLKTASERLDDGLDLNR